MNTDGLALYITIADFNRYSDKLAAFTFSVISLTEILLKLYY